MISKVLVPIHVWNDNASLPVKLTPERFHMMVVLQEKIDEMALYWFHSVSFVSTFPLSYPFIGRLWLEG